MVARTEQGGDGQMQGRLSAGRGNTGNPMVQGGDAFFEYSIVGLEIRE